MALEKQPDWIDTKHKLISDIIDWFSPYKIYPCLWGACVPMNMVVEILETYIQKDLFTQEDTYQKTTVPNVLLYETGYKEWYQKGRDSMLNDCINNYEFILNELWKRYIDREFIVRKVLSPTDTK